MSTKFLNDVQIIFLDRKTRTYSVKSKFLFIHNNLGRTAEAVPDNLIT